MPHHGVAQSKGWLVNSPMWSANAQVLRSVIAEAKGNHAHKFEAFLGKEVLLQSSRGILIY